MRAVAAGLLYFALVFLLGATLGSFRITVIEPRWGGFVAVLLELPLMLAASWFICGWLVRHLAVPATHQSSLLMGLSAFGLLMVAELTLTVLAAGGSVASHFAAYREPAALIGLGGQLVFALLPLAARRSSRTAP